MLGSWSLDVNAAFIVAGFLGVVASRWLSWNDLWIELVVLLPASVLQEHLSIIIMT